MTSEWEALVVGINRYPQMTTLHDLMVAAKDAEDIAVQLRDYGYQPLHKTYPKLPTCGHPWNLLPASFW